MAMAMAVLLQLQVVAVLVGVAAVSELGAVSALYLCPPALETLDAMQPCMPAVEGSQPGMPDEECCYLVRTTEPACLCVAFAGYKDSRSVNFLAALSLPRNCGRDVVNFTCNGVLMPPARLPPSRKLLL